MNREKLTKVVTLRDREGNARRVTRVLYGGYASWTDRRGRCRCKEVRVWGPTTWDPDYYDDPALFEALTTKARKRWPAAEVREAWRY